MPPFDLEPGEVHVWLADLDAPPHASAAYRSLLDAAESERAGRLRFEHLRLRFICGRGILRQLLGRYLGMAPAALTFRYGSYGKPELAATPSARRLAFNLAHTQNLAVYAFALAPRIGVDVEQVREVHDRHQIVERFFSLRERQAIAALPDSEREEAFFLCWTRKEAYLKALGAGITCPLDRFSVSLTPGEPAVLLESAAEEQANGDWTLLAFTPTTEHRAAVAVEGRGWMLRCRWWGTPDDGC